VFSSARAALRAAVDLLARCAAAATPELPLRAGVGLEVGEPVPVPGSYLGEAVNVAARLCAQAGAGGGVGSGAGGGGGGRGGGGGWRGRSGGSWRSGGSPTGWGPGWCARGRPRGRRRQQ